MNDLLVDVFAGGGGASTGIYLATGRHPDIAIDYDPEAIRCHMLNHPTTRHYLESVWNVDPLEVCAGTPVGLAWFSPDCTHFSSAKGGLEVSDGRRSLAWIVNRWAKTVKPRIIILENVEEFRTWGPLDGNGRPDKSRQGETFTQWLQELESLGYITEFRTLYAHHYGAPTIRKRLFMIARCDGRPITWPESTHGEGLLPYLTAKECIDWSVPTSSIFSRVRPLSEVTLRRIAGGVMRFGRASNNPHVSAFLKKYDTGMVDDNLDRPAKIEVSGEFNSLTSYGLFDGGLRYIQAFLMSYYGKEKGSDCLDRPLRTVVTKDRFGLVIVNESDGYIDDISMRMLQPHELLVAQGFPASYRLDGLSKTAQVRLIGNSVSPPVAAALIRSNYL